MQGTIHSSLLLPVPPSKPLCLAIHLMVPIQTNLSHINKYTNKHLLNCTFPKSLSNQYLGMSHLKKCRSPLKIFKKKKDFAWNPQPWRHCVQRVLFKFNPISGVNFSNDISIPHITWHNFETSYLLTINLKMNPSIIL